MAARPIVVLVLIACEGALVGCRRTSPRPTSADPAADTATPAAEPNPVGRRWPTLDPTNSLVPPCSPGDPLCPPASDLVDPVVRMGPKGFVNVGSAEVTGGRVPNVDRVVAGMRSGFRACYNRGLLSDPSQRGSLRVIASVTGDGAVTNVKLDGGQGLTPPITSCIIRRVQAASFNRPEGRDIAISFPVTLEPPKQE